jgi:hypothetical protein
MLVKHEIHEIGGNVVGLASTSTRMSGPGLAGPQAADFGIQPQSGGRMVPRGVSPWDGVCQPRQGPNEAKRVDPSGFSIAACAKRRSE